MINLVCYLNTGVIINSYPSIVTGILTQAIGILTRRVSTLASRVLISGCVFIQYREERGKSLVSNFGICFTVFDFFFFGRMG